MLFSVLIISSCVTNKKFQLLQQKDVNTNNVKDSVVRSYTITTFDYKIQPNDVLSIHFRTLSDKDFDFLSEGVSPVSNNIATLQFSGDLVDTNGEVPFPVIGKVKVSGLNVMEIQDKLQKLAEQYLENPIVKVRLVNYRITVLGEVKSESSIILTNNRVSMMEAIGQAGGLSDLADRSNVKLIRQKGDVAEVQYLNLLDENFINSPYYYVNQNDILIVPPLRQRPFRKYFGQNLALVASSITLLLLAYNIANNY